VARPLLAVQAQAESLCHLVESTRRHGERAAISLGPDSAAC
jgi:hypothetical protein